MSFLGRFNSSKASSTTGFTLVELLVVIMILGVLATFVLVILNPITQIQKSQDAQRQHDLKQLQIALDSYYNDNNNYPPQPLLALIADKNIQAIPNDPVVSSGWKNYAYLDDTNNNPQWNVLFGKLVLPSPTNSFSCPLEQMKDSAGQPCVPANYTSLGYNYCVISGSIGVNICDQIVTMQIVPLPIWTPSSNPPVNNPPVNFVCYCSNARYVYVPTNPLSHQCLIDPLDSNPSSNYNRYCNPPLNGTGPCADPCTP